MSISGQNLSIIIVTLKSEQVIDECINSIDPEIPIIIVENSNNLNFKRDCENKYKNVKCVLTNKNLGMGTANNIGIKLATTDYVYVLNPDVILEKDCLKKIFSESKKLNDFSILTPISSNSIYPNWKNKIGENLEKNNPFEVESIDGYSMIINKKKFNEDYFDENIFLYLENDDLCLRTRRVNGSIFVVPESKINHKGAKAVDTKYKDEIEYSRNWHWTWSKFYFQKKHYGFIKSFFYCLPSFFSSLIKFFLYSIFVNKHKKKIYFNRISGFSSSFLGKKSWYRPNLED